MLFEAANYVPFDSRTADSIEHWNGFEFGVWRELSKLLQDEGHAAELIGEYDRAAEFALANVRLGTMLQRGDLIFADIHGTFAEGIAHRDLTVLRDKLSTSKSQEVIDVLHRTTTEIEPFELIHNRDLAFEERARGWEQRFEHIVKKILLGQSSRPYQDGSWRLRSRAYRALLQSDLAIRVFRQRNGRLPKDLRDVSSLLPQSPLDPFSGNWLIYVPTGDAFVLYSVGEDGRDDGGRFGNQRDHNLTPGFDLDLDTLTRP